MEPLILWMCIIDSHQGLDEACEGEVCTFTNESWNGVLAAGNILELTYQAKFEETEDHPELVSIAFNGEEACVEEYLKRFVWNIYRL